MSSTERLLNKVSIQTKISGKLTEKAEDMAGKETFTYEIDWVNKNVTLSVCTLEGLFVRQEVYTFEQLGASEETIADYWIYNLNLPTVGVGAAIRIFNEATNDYVPYNGIVLSINNDQVSYITNLADHPLCTRQLTSKEIFVNDITIKRLYSEEEVKNMYKDIPRPCPPYLHHGCSCELMCKK